MNEIHDLIEQLEGAIAKAFPTATGASITIHMDGYRSFIAERVQPDENLPPEAWKRRELMDQWKRIGGEWTDDRSGEQNAYYRERKLLLEG